MSGSKRKSQYRKSATTEYLSSEISIDPSSDIISKVVRCKGSNLFELSLSSSDEIVNGILPNRFRNLIWIKRNDFVVVESNSTSIIGKVETEIPSSSNYQIKEILNRNQIKYLKSFGLWPSRFADDDVTLADDSYGGDNISSTIGAEDTNDEDLYDDVDEPIECFDSHGNSIIVEDSAEQGR